MTLPPPPSQHKLIASVSRFTHQLERTRAYFDVVRGTLPPSEDDPNVQYFFQTIILMVHTFLEEYYRHLIWLATFWNPDPVRIYLKQKNPTQADTIDALPFAELARVAAAEVSFRKDAARIKGILAVLINTPPFADAQAEAKCLDLVRVRNVITHQGGQPDEVMALAIQSPDVVVSQQGALGGVFYSLRISGRFLLDALAEIARSIRHIEEALKRNPCYRI